MKITVILNKFNTYLEAKQEDRVAFLNKLKEIEADKLV